jgi:hypothetical protein
LQILDCRFKDEAIGFDGIFAQSEWLMELSNGGIGESGP